MRRGGGMPIVQVALEELAQVAVPDSAQELRDHLAGKPAKRATFIFMTRAPVISRGGTRGSSA
jgi:hypothetical protein